MTLQERADKAVELKANGNNCCQAVALALADQTNLDEQTLRLVAAGFGMGMGNMEGVCGAMVGAAMVVGVKTNGDRSVPTAKAVQLKFREKCGALLCKDLKAKDPETGKVLCSCEDCVKNAVLAYGEVMNLE